MRRGTEINRRDLLRGLGAAGIMLPLFSSMRSAFANPLKTQKRLALFFTPDGTIHDSWRPTGTESNFQLQGILQSLDPFKQKLVVVDGLANELPNTGDVHRRAIAQLFTGADVHSGEKPKGESVDQFIARYLQGEQQKQGKAMRFRSRQFSVQAEAMGSDIATYSIYDSNGAGIRGEEDPYKAFQEMFAGTQGTPKIDELRQKRKSVLDAVVQELNQLKGTLSTNDGQRLDKHLTNVRELERQISTVPSANACTQPTLPGGIAYKDNNHYDKVGKMQMDLMALCLSCNMTPVASLQWSRSVSKRTFPWLGIGTPHHVISHAGVSDSNTQQLVKIYTWYAQQFAYFLGKLNDAKEADGSSVLDNTIVVWGSEFGDGRGHKFYDLPFVLAGGSGFLKTGRYLKFPKESKVSHNQLLVSLCHGMGLTHVNSFGDQRFTGPLRGLTV